MSTRMHVEIDARCVRTCLDRKHRIALELAVVGVVAGRVLRVVVGRVLGVSVMRVDGPRQSDRQLTRVAENHQEREGEHERRRNPRDHVRTVAAPPFLCQTVVRTVSAIRDHSTGVPSWAIDQKRNAMPPKNERGVPGV